MNVITAQGRVRITWPAQSHVPPGGYYRLYRRLAGGAFDYDSPINLEKILAWPDARHPGAGYGPAGQRPAGMSVLSAPCGYGPAGFGAAGFGTFSYEYITGWQDDADYEFCAIAYDAAGNRTTPAVAIGSVTVAGEPLPPKNFSADSYDSGAGVTDFSWDLTEDDRAA